MLYYLLPLIAGLIAQYIDGSLGMGYGVSSSSILVAAGFMPALVSASVHMAETFTTFTSGISHFKFGNVDKDILLPLIFPGIIGGAIGAYILSDIIPTKAVKIVVSFILLSLGLVIFLRFYFGKIRKREGNFSKRFLIVVALAGGLLDAIGGGGWGPVCTSSLVATNKREPRKVIGSVNLAEFFVTLAITTTFAITLGIENFLWSITLPLIIGGIIAAPLAAYTCRKIPSILLGSMVGILLIVINARTIISSFISVNFLVILSIMVLIFAALLIIKYARMEEKILEEQE
ncbi:MAG: sulfite exporter TauE/SafE family protein [Thermoplasmatales archaeon]|nr:sulfite exporter TauE/SafE family protein [Thermoplasmatales archaeon]